MSIKTYDKMQGTLKPAVSTASSAPGIEVVGDRLYFYADITRETILKLNKVLYEMAHSALVDACLYGSKAAGPIILHIQSHGGSVFAGLSGMDSILRCPVPVITVVDGCAASAATFLSVVGNRRAMSRNAYMLVHQLSSSSWGTYEQLKDDQKNNDMLMAKIKEIYRKYTKIPAKKIDEILRHDLWWDAKTCLKYGLVDEII